MLYAFLIVFLLALIVLLIRRILFLHDAIKSLLKELQSTRVSHGKTIEQFFPFFKNYKYDPKNFRFLGSPIDGVQFNKDKIIFIEFKTGKSQLTDEQRRIKELVEKKKVAFEEIRV